MLIYQRVIFAANKQSEGGARGGLTNMTMIPESTINIPRYRV